MSDNSRACVYLGGSLDENWKRVLKDLRPKQHTFAVRLRSMKFEANAGDQSL